MPQSGICLKWSGWEWWAPSWGQSPNCQWFWWLYCMPECMQQRSKVTKWNI